VSAVGKFVLLLVLSFSRDGSIKFWWCFEIEQAITRRREERKFVD